MIKEEWITCPICKGTGYHVPLRTHVFTFGISWVFEKLTPSTHPADICTECDGTRKVLYKKTIIK